MDKAQFIAAYIAAYLAQDAVMRRTDAGSMQPVGLAAELAAVAWMQLEVVGAGV